MSERRNLPCPQILGIDEHFFSRRHGHATTFCDLKNHRMHDVVLGRSEASLENYLECLEGKQAVKVVCMDLAMVYRSIVRRHFTPCAHRCRSLSRDRLVNQHFLTCWKELDPAGSKNRGLLSLMRRYRHNLRPEQQQRLFAYLAQRPVLEVVYRFKQRLCYLLLENT